ncbi:tRNA pseudouridine synthase A [Arthrobacter saudimassiliensis]|uniref:tRNA pseudouridine synthase A n=1 Tax=Arthrobacter saudimassiliensis TaxID=1461584 RepID=A0A078MNP3_9MICC|nr:tRNA pseudouridine synthase A [Arthrobacter saudimassiliensis]
MVVMTIEGPAAPHGDGGFLRIRLDLAYDGAAFSGWAAQPGLRTVQGTLEDSLAVLLRRPVRLTVAGRTDAGVHARGQVAHLDLAPGEWEGLTRGHDLEPEEALLRRLRGVMNRELTLPLRESGTPRRMAEAMAGAIQVFSARPAPEGFDARFSALWRRYSYRIADRLQNQDPLTRGITLWHRSELDVDRMNEGAAAVLGVHDFLSFCKPRLGATTIRELQAFGFARGADGVITASLRADAFCHSMVRSLIGAALKVGSGERTPAWLAERLFAQVRDSKSLLAPPHPLVLEEVRYPDDDGLRARADRTRALRDSAALSGPF